MENQIEVFDFAFTGKTKASKGSRYFTAAQQTALESLAVGKAILFPKFADSTIANQKMNVRFYVNKHFKGTGKTFKYMETENGVVCGLLSFVPPIVEQPKQEETPAEQPVENNAGNNSVEIPEDVNAEELINA